MRRRRIILLLICLIPILGTLWGRSYFVADSVRCRVGPPQYASLSLALSSSYGSSGIHVYLVRGGSGSWLYCAHGSGLPRDPERGTRWFDISWSSLDLQVPYWVVIALIASSTVWLLRRERRAQKLARSICLVCGYDLRASQERCPECGTAIPVRPAAVSP